MKYNNNRNFSKTVTITLLSVLIAWACNPNKEKWLNKKWHSLVGHYNIYFNGEQKLNDAIATLSAGHVNDFNKTLDIFQYGTDGAAKGVSNVLDEAMKKFSGTIQLHKVGSYTDEAWFAIAKTHFFKRDYYASQEAMQFVIGKYPAEYKNIATAWIAKSYIGLGKPQEAEAVISLVLSSKNIAKKDITEIYLTAADINIKLEKYKSAIENLNKVVKDGRLNKDQKIRYYFILGQLYMQANDNPNALLNFNKVVKLVPNYDFAFNSNINITKLYDINNKKEVNKVRRRLKRMAKDDKNEDYISQIYFEIGRLELSQKNIQPAILAFKKSIENSTKVPSQKPKSCYELAKLYFDIKDYKNARAYYDTTANLYDKKEKIYSTILSTKNVLGDLINNLETYENEDSLQTLSKLSKDALNKKVTDWIATETKQKELAAKEAKKRKLIESSMAANQSLPGATTNAPTAFDNSAGGSQWYFYNTNLVSSGIAEFFGSRKWGNRPNEDYWRLSAKEKIKQAIEADSSEDGETKKEGNTANNGTGTKNSDTKSAETAEDVPVLFGDNTKDAWLKNVPFTKSALENSNLSMLEALHNLGIIYYSKIKNYNEAITYFNILQKRFPENEYEPETWYYLHKSHSELNEKQNANKYKDDLLNKYPKNPYSLLLLGKSANTAATDQNKDLVKLYDLTYEAYKIGNYDEVKRLKLEADKKYPGNNFRPKFELINALTIGKTGKLEEFKLALAGVSKEFPKTDVADEANEILGILNSNKKKVDIVKKDSVLAEFNLEPNEKHYYILAVKNLKANFTDYVEKIYSYNEAYASNDNLKINAMVSNEGYQYLLVREFPNQKKADDYYKGIVANNLIINKLKITEPYVDFVISVNNYKNIMRDKQIEKYNNFYKKIPAKQPQ